MPRRPEIDSHPQKDKIINALVMVRPFREISALYGVSMSALSRYLRDHLVKRAAIAEEKRVERDGRTILEQLDGVMGRMTRMYDACHEYLKDPNDPDKYFLGPRAEEVEIVTYGYDENGRPTRQEKHQLDTLLKQIESADRQVVSLRHTGTDPRLLILKTAEVLTRQLELIAKIRGAVVQHVTINNIQNWTEVKQIILQATASHPEVREKIVKGLKKLEGEKP